MLLNKGTLLHSSQNLPKLIKEVNLIAYDIIKAIKKTLTLNAKEVKAVGTKNQTPDTSITFPSAYLKPSQQFTHCTP